MPGAAVVAHLAVVVIWVACAVVAAGAGFLVLRLIGGAAAGRAAPYAAAWTGIAAITLFLQSWHFAFPVDGRALLLVVLAGAAGIAMRLRGVAVRRDWIRPGMPAILGAAVFAAMALWLANRSLAPFAAYDSEMYLVPGVQWARTFPLVPGLGALHGRFGFNNSNVLLAALLESGPWQPASPHLLNGFFLFLLAARAADGIGRLARPAPAERMRATFDAVLFAPIVAIALDDQLLPGLSADVAVAAALFAGAGLLLEHAATPAERRDAATPVAAAAALALALTLKLSAAVFAIAGLAIAIGSLIRDAGPTTRRRVALTALFCAALVGTWMARGVMTTGYPLYPASLAAFPVDWRVPLEQVRAEAAWVAHFARTWYSPELANGGAGSGDTWFRPWLAAVATGRDAALIFLPLLCAAAFELALIAKRKAWATPRFPSVTAPAILGLGFWFLTAPRPSLGIGAAWVLGAVAIARWFGRTGTTGSARGAFALVALLPLVVAANAVRTRGDPASLRGWHDTLLAYPDPAHWFREPANPELEDFVTRSGLILHVPARRNLCRRAPPPCTPHPAPNLRLRVPGELQHGFRIDGAWQPSRWPNPSSRFLDSWRAARAAGR